MWSRDDMTMKDSQEKVPPRSHPSVSCSYIRIIQNLVSSEFSIKAS